MKKKYQEQPLEKLDIQFCTECNEELNEFDLSVNPRNLDALKAHHEHCKATGKFKGEMCAKLFIAAIQPDEE
jgi:hypothetical protein